MLNLLRPFSEAQKLIGSLSSNRIAFHLYTITIPILILYVNAIKLSYKDTRFKGTITVDRISVKVKARSFLIFNYLTYPSFLCTVANINGHE